MYYGDQWYLGQPVKKNDGDMGLSHVHIIDHSSSLFVLQRGGGETIEKNPRRLRIGPGSRGRGPQTAYTQCAAVK